MNGCVGILCSAVCLAVVYGELNMQGNPGAGNERFKRASSREDRIARRLKRFYPVDEFEQAMGAITRPLDARLLQQQTTIDELDDLKDSAGDINSRLESFSEKYVPIETIDERKGDVYSLDESLNSLQEDMSASLAALSEDEMLISQLEAQYEKNVVRKCENYGDDTCSPYCYGQPSGPTEIFSNHTFASKFHEIPSVLISISQYADYFGSPIHRSMSVFSVDEDQVKVLTQQFSKSQVHNMNLMACA